MKRRFEVNFFYDWDSNYDWVVIPSIIIAFRDNKYSIRLHKVCSGVGVGLIFLKWKLQIIFATYIKNEPVQ